MDLPPGVGIAGPVGLTDVFCVVWQHGVVAIVATNTSAPLPHTWETGARDSPSVQSHDHQRLIRKILEVLVPGLPELRPKSIDFSFCWAELALCIHPISSEELVSLSNGLLHIKSPILEAVDAFSWRKIGTICPQR